MILNLIKYRDNCAPHIYFWVDENNVTVGPIFTTEQDAMKWNKEHDFVRLESGDDIKPDDATRPE